MVRIGLMSNGNWSPNRRALLAGLGAAALAGGISRAAFSASNQTLQLRAKSDSLALRPGQAETPIWSLEGPNRPLRIKRAGNVEIALQNGLDWPTVANWHG